MTYQIILKNNGTSGVEPTTANLSLYEMGLNIADGNLYINTGTTIQKLASTSNITVSAPPLPSGLVFEKIESDTSDTNFLYYNVSYDSANMPVAYQNLTSTSLTVSTTYNHAATLTNKKIEQVNSNYCGVFNKGSSNNFRYTADGVTWSSATLPVTTTWQELAYDSANDVLVVVSSNTNMVYGNSTLTGFTSNPFLTLSQYYRASVRSPFGYCIVTNGRTSWLVSNTESLKGPYNSYLGNLPVSADWRDITWNGSVFCTVAYNTAIAATSPDGITWTQRALPASRTWIGISNNGTALCAIAYNTNIVAVSLDSGVTWTEYNLPTSRQWTKIASNGSGFLAVTNNTNYVAVSTDSGVTWTEYPNLTISAPTALIWDGVRYVAYNYNAPGGGSTSTDGITWTAYYYAGRNQILSLNYLPDLGIYCIGSLYDGSVWSTDLINWYPLNTNYPPNSNYNNGGYPIIHGEFTEGGTTYGFIITHRPRISIFHTMVPGSAPTQESFYGGVRSVVSQHVCFGNGTFVAVSNTQLLYSTDGVNWNYSYLPEVNGLDTFWVYGHYSNMAWTDLIWTGSLFVLMTSNNTEYLTSPDGVTWTIRTLPVNLAWRKMEYVNSTLCLLSSTATNSNLYTSSDGITWSASSLPKAADFRSVTILGSDITVCDSSGNLYIQKTATVWKSLKLFVDTGYATELYTGIPNKLIASSSTTYIYTIDVDLTKYQLSVAGTSYTFYMVI